MENKKGSNDFLLGEIHAKVQDIPFIRDKVEELEKRMCKMESRVSALEVKSGVWGGLAGIITSLILLSVVLWKKALG